MSTSVSSERRVYLPLERLTTCSVCQGAQGKLHLCSACGERAYCSEKCQKQDWKSHKQECGKTDRVGLESFYPFLAWLVLTNHMHTSKPVHFALTHPIINDINPYSIPTKLTDGSGWEAKLAIVDDREEPTIGIDLSKWFPLAHTPNVAGKMFRRILLSGYVLPILTAVGASLLAEMYTTTSSAGSNERRVRLKYRSSPIADFGIATGSAEVTGQDMLAYYSMSTGSIIHGQDPDEHYWLYFTTIRGEEVTLDCGMFTFNLCNMVRTQEYAPQSDFPVDLAPAFFAERAVRKNAPPVQKERRRLSILRDTSLHEAIRHSGVEFPRRDWRPFYRFMEKLSGKKLTTTEEDLFFTWACQNCQNLGTMLRTKLWQKYPEHPSICIEGDPGELDDLDDKSSAWAKRAKEWKRSQKKRRD